MNYVSEKSHKELSLTMFCTPPINEHNNCLIISWKIPFCMSHIPHYLAKQNRIVKINPKNTKGGDFEIFNSSSSGGQNNCRFDSE